MPDPTVAAAMQCLQCGEAMQGLGVHEFRFGGAPRGQFLFRGWAEHDEDILPLEVHVCMPCRRVEFGVPDGLAIVDR